jgi:hypothetical protein
MITQKRLKELLKYDPETGIFEWKVSRGRMSAYTEAGATNVWGYRKIKIFGQLHSAHRLAWVYVYGVMPTGEIDHIDKNKINNRIANLRDVSKSENMMNQKLHSNNTTGHRGICYSYQRDRFCVYVRRKYYGSYRTLQDAIKARDNRLEGLLPVTQTNGD